jgi:multidrug efflux pump subunit AcrA (membrane-fusion protein)
MIKIIVPLLVVTLVVAAAFLLPRDRAAARYYEQITVQRGAVSDVLRETGVLSTRDPVVVKTRIKGPLEWIVEDEHWVDQGAKLFVINDEEVLREVAEQRTEMLNTRQELALAHLRREHARRLEDQKVEAAERQLELAQVRYRILSTQPKGGTHLLDIHEKLLPLERQTAGLRSEYEKAQNTYERAQDAYLERFDEWQERKDAIIRIQAKIDEHTVRSEADVDAAKPQELVAQQEATKQLAEARAESERLRAGLDELKQTRKTARAAADAARQPRDELLAQLELREVAERDLYIQLEIEKRGVKLAQLQLDRQAARLALTEAQRKQRDGQTAFDSGAISAASLEQLGSQVLAAEKDLSILDEKVKIAARPEPAEVLTEARLEMEKADALAKDIRKVRDRKLETLDQEITVLEAKIARAMHAVQQVTQGFATVIESNIEFLKKELEALDDDEQQRRDEIDKELKGLATDLERARANPPNVSSSAVAGVVRLNRRWGRVYHVGDRVQEDDIVMEIFPALNMEVRSAVNEANVRHVHPDMTVRMTVPALADRVLTGSIALLAGVGKDKLDGAGGWNSSAFAGVTQFETRIKLDKVTDDLRPGMTVVVEITLSRQEDVLYLPRSAVRMTDGKATVLTGRAEAPELSAVSGRPFGDDLYLIDGGLSQGQVVFVERKKSN